MLCHADGVVIGPEKDLIILLLSVEMLPRDDLSLHTLRGNGYEVAAKSHKKPLFRG